MQRRNRAGSLHAAATPFAIAGLCLAICAANNQAQAFTIESANPDLSMSLDTTVRYNQGWRVDKRDTKMANSAAVDEGNYLFDKGDVMLSRLDLFSEFDLNYNGQYGLRISGAAWYDHNFPDKSVSAPGLEASANYQNNRYSGIIKRYYAGPSAEFRDYFVWGNFELGQTNLNAKLGAFAWLPGEFVLGNGSSMSYSMAPNDGRLGDLSPGASAKETALPIGQFATTWQLNNELSLMLQYTYEYRPSRISEGGTYFAVSDGGIDGPTYLSGPAVWRADSLEGENGDISVGVRWAPEWAANSSFNLWYRKFDDKSASWANQMVIGSNRYARAVYARDIELYGLTWGGVYQSVSIGAELNYRKNMPLATTGQTFMLNGGPEPSNLDGARGTTIHGLLSGTMTLNKNPVFDSGSLAAQLDYTHLVKVTDNEQFFNGSTGEGGSVAGRCVDKQLIRNCVTDNAVSVGVNFTPTWQQVMPSIDVSFPVFINYGLYGNAAAANSGVMPQDSYLVRVGPRLEYFRGALKHQFDLTYTMRNGRQGTVNGATARSGLRNMHDRDAVILTYQTAF